MIGRSEEIMSPEHNVVLCANRSSWCGEKQRPRERGAIDASESAAILFPSWPFLSLQRPFSVSAATFGRDSVCGGVPKRPRCWNVKINPPATCRPLMNQLIISRLMSFYLIKFKWIKLNSTLHFKEVLSLHLESNKIMAEQNRYASQHFLLTQLLSSRTLRGQTKITTKKEREIQSGFQPVSVCSPDKCQLISKKFIKLKSKNLIKFLFNTFLQSHSNEIFENFVNCSWMCLNFFLKN